MRLNTPSPESTGRRGISKRTGVVSLLAAAAVSFVVGIADLRKSERLRADGLLTTARLSGKHTERSRSWRHHYLDIEYHTATGQIVSARDDVAVNVYDRVKIGDTISVRYLPSEPDVHAIGATVRRDTFMLWMAGLCIALTGIYALFGK